MSDNVPLLRLYEFMRSISGEERLELARWITAKPELFNEWSRRSLRFFARYSNVDEDFHPPRAELPAADTVKEIRRGYDVAVLLADRPRGRWWPVEAVPELGFRFVDYELAPLRKTSTARVEKTVSGKFPGRRICQTRIAPALSRKPDLVLQIATTSFCFKRSIRSSSGFSGTRTPRTLTVAPRASMSRRHPRMPQFRSARCRTRGCAETVRPAGREPPR